MTATNHTEHYELSQYVGDDHPTYTGDYNSDMSKIDAAIYAASQTGGGGMTTVAHTADLTGDGTDDNPLGVADTIARAEDIPSLNGYATAESVTQAIAAAIADRLTAGDIKAGNGINIATSGNQVTISYVGGGSAGGLSAVAHDATLTGDGTSGTPLGVIQGGLFLNPLPDHILDLDSIDADTVGKIYYITKASQGTKPPANVEGVCLKLRASALAVLEIVYSNDNAANIFIRRNYRGTWWAWQKVAMTSDIPNVSTLTSRIAALESQVAALTTAATPAATGLTAEQLDSQYLDDYNIVRVGTSTPRTETEVSSQ